MAPPHSTPLVDERRKSSRVLPITGPNISNIVCGVNLNCLFDLQNIALHGRNVTYRPKKFSAVVIRIREPKATALVFSNGKMQVLGTKSLADAHLAARKFARMLQKMGYRPRMEGFTVQNIVASADTRMVIRLEGLHRNHYDTFAKYEPELFPGLVWTMMEPRMTALVFSGGKVVLLGAKTVEDVEEAIQKLYPVLVEYKRT